MRQAARRKARVRVVRAGVVVVQRRRAAQEAAAFRCMAERRAVGTARVDERERRGCCCSTRVSV